MKKSVKPEAERLAQQCKEIRTELEKLLPELQAINKDDFGVLKYSLIVLEAIERLGIHYSRIT